MIHCKCLLILLVALKFAEPQGKLMLPPPPPPFLQTNRTAAGLYNYQTQKCCLGSIQDSIKPDYQKCCGAKAYDISKQLCCNENVLDMTPASACCGNGTINTDLSICCGGEKVDIPQQDTNLISYAKCCGQTSYYDSRSQTCCSTAADVKVLEGTGKLCCGEEVYDESNQVCCLSFKNGTTSSKVVPKDGNKFSCCGDTLIDYSTENCCDDKVVELNGCCGSMAFNTSTQLCCNNQDVIEKNGTDMQCCGEKTFDGANHLCCYDSATQSFAIVPKTDSNQTFCCGLEPYDGEKQLCCYQTQKLAIKKNKDDYQCCGDTSFNSAKQQCCGGKPVDIGNDICCGDAEGYDPKTKICCTKFGDNGTLEGHAIADNPNFKLSCCGLKTYDTSSEMCCGSTLFPNSLNKACCGDKIYDFTKEVCCTETVFSKQSNQDACCFYGSTDAKQDRPVCLAHDNV